MAPPVLNSEPESPLVRALLHDRGMAPGDVFLGIDPDDEMLGFLVATNGGDRERALYSYFQSGASIAASMAQILRWRHGDAARVGTLLDFASGYGRVTRFLRLLLPADRIWVSDIYAAGVRFQERCLGVHGIVSTVLPQDFPEVAAAAGPAAGFDAILVTSLFTHLPEERFVAWLRVLMALLAPGGVLAFSVHDQCLLPPGTALPASGLLFQELSESGTLATHDYGSTWVSERFVRDALTRALAGSGAAGSLHRLPRGLCSFQDLYVAVGEADADFSRLAYRGEPRFFVERCSVVSSDRLEISGWAALPGGGGVVAVEALLDGQPATRIAVDRDRPEVAQMLGDERQPRLGWQGSLELPPGLSRSASVLRLRLVDDLGNVHPMVASSLEAALHGASRNELTWVLGRLHRAEDESARKTQQADALAARIAMMEASRFWKLRNQWFRIKGWLGLGGG
jgi:SAM-dependent methyltransferase